MLLEGLYGARTRPPVRYLFYLFFRRGLHHLLTRCEIREVLPIARWRRCNNAVRSICTQHVQVTIFETTLAIVEHGKGLFLVLFHGSNSLIEHRFGFTHVFRILLPELW